MATKTERNRKDSKVHDKIIRLNVGGQLFTTSLETLKKYPDSMLGKMFTQDGIPPAIMDDKGNYFIDRDGTLFQYILNFLRCDELHLPKLFGDMEQLKSEVDFYALTEMTEALKNYHPTPSGRETMWIRITSYIECPLQSGMMFKEPDKLHIYCAHATFYSAAFSNEVKETFEGSDYYAHKFYNDMTGIVRISNLVNIQVSRYPINFFDAITKAGFSYKGIKPDDIMIYERELV